MGTITVIWILMFRLLFSAIVLRSHGTISKLHLCDNCTGRGVSLNKSVNQELTEVLLSRVASGVRPVSDPSLQVQVHILGALYQIVDVDQRNNLATINAYFDMWWTDKYLQWEPDDFNGTVSTYLPAKMVWIPELYLYHSIQGSTPLFLQESAVQISYTGKVRTFVPFTARALCPINVKYFPFDNQSCNLTFGSWSYRQENVEYFVESEHVFLQDFYDNQEWILDAATLRKISVDYYTDKHNETYSAVVMEMKMTRQSFYYVFNLVIPTTLVSVVAVVGFHAPGSSSPRRETKFRLGIMTLLSMGVMLLMVVNEMPKFSLASIPGQRGSFSDVPLLGIYYIFLICTISLSTCTTSIFVVMERFALSHPDPRHIPYCIRWLGMELDFCKWLCRRLSRKTDKGTYKDKVSKEAGMVSVVEKIPLNHDENGISLNAGIDRALRFQPQSLSETHQNGKSPLGRVYASVRSNQNERRGSQNDQPLSGSEALRTVLEKMVETMSVISGQLQETQNSLAQARFGSVESLAGPRRSPSLGGATLTREWQLLINRCEYFSLFFYLGAIITMLFLLFHPAWY